MSEQQKLKPCPACRGEAGTYLDQYIVCKNVQCEVCGPSDDKTGAKWNALPRREDKDIARYEEAAAQTARLRAMVTIADASVRLGDELRKAVAALAPPAAQPDELVNAAHAVRAAIIAQCPTLHAVTVVFETMEHPTHCERVKDGWTVFVHLDGKCERFAAPTAAEVQAKAEAFLREEMAEAAQPEADEYADVQGRWKRWGNRRDANHWLVEGSDVSYVMAGQAAKSFSFCDAADIRAAVARGELWRCDEQGRIIEPPRPEDVEAAKIDAACERGREQEVQS